MWAELCTGFTVIARRKVLGFADRMIGFPETWHDAFDIIVVGVNLRIPRFQGSSKHGATMLFKAHNLNLALFLPVDYITGLEALISHSSPECR